MDKTGTLNMVGKVVGCSEKPEYGEGLCTLYSENHGAFICYNNHVVRYHICKLDEVIHIREASDEDRKKFGTPR
jgi:hypothetical protein